MDNCLRLAITLFGTACDWCELLHWLLLNSAHFLGPFRALGVGCVARGFIFALPFNLSLALNNIIFNIMFLLLSLAL